MGQRVDGPVVLVIDDERCIRDLFARILDCGGFFPVLADNGETALALIRRGLNPHAILLDLKMPGMGGLGFLLKLRADPRCCTIPVAIVTGQCVLASPVHHAAELLNAQIHFKPLEMDGILELTARLIASPARDQGVTG